MNELSRREIEVLVLASEGKHNRAIAEQLYVGDETVKSHLKSIFRKLDVSSRHELRPLIESTPELRRIIDATV